MCVQIISKENEIGKEKWSNKKKYTCVERQ
jgi:hypothetical protein